jgi:Putative zinc-finger
MNRPTIIDKAQLAAFADGELSPEEAAAVVMHLADHPEDQTFVDEVMAANLALGRAFAAPLQEPVPARFTALLLPETAQLTTGSANIIAFPKALRTRVVLAGLLSAGLAIAAALTAVAFLPSAGTGLSVGPVAQGSALNEVLFTTPSGETVAFGAQNTVTVLSSLPAKAGYCREFEVVSQGSRQVQLGLACQDGNGWTLDVVVTEVLQMDDGSNDGYAAASGHDDGAIVRWLDRRGAGSVMTAAQEAERIAAGWAP